MMNTAGAWGDEAGRRTGGGSRLFGYELICHDLGERSKRQRRIVSRGAGTG
jgi:hypothetical protein